MNSMINFLAIFTRYLLDFLVLFIFLRVILSWFPIPPGRFNRFLRNVTDPLFRSMQRLPFTRIGILDLTPIWAFLALEILDTILRNIFLSLGANPGIYYL